MSDGSGRQARRTTLDGVVLSHVESDACRRFVTLWRQFRGDALMPGPGFNPLRFGPILPAVSLVEVRTEWDMEFRIVSRAMEQSYGYTVKGMSPIDLMPPEIRPITAWRYSRLVLQPCGLYVLTAMTAATGLVIEYEGVLLPVGPRPGGLGQVLLCTVPVGTPRTVADYAGPATQLSREFAFIDIGAGTPDRDVPPGLSADPPP